VSVDRDHIALTLDGSVSEHGAWHGAMRWMPPEQAELVRAADARSIAKARLARQLNERGVPLGRQTELLRRIQ